MADISPRDHAPQSFGGGEPPPPELPRGEAPRRKPRAKRRGGKRPRWQLVVGALGGLAFAGLIIAAIAVMLVIRHYTKDLPNYDQLANYEPPIVTRLYANDGKLMAEYATENRVFISYQAIPKKVVNAFLAAEDRNFWTHQGVDLLALVRAVKENVTNIGSGRSMVGGSTITQQVVKNFLLTSEKSFERKIREAILAYRISKTYSKEKILELYLNQIYLGMNSYGVATASLNYFNKPLEELSTEEVALLAAMPKAPSNYNPRTNYEGAIQRRNYVINRMAEDGYIDAVETARALKAPIVLNHRDVGETARADFFAEEVRRTLQKLYGTNVLYEGGLTVKTTVDARLQEAADKGLRKALIDYDRRYGYRGPVRKLTTRENLPKQFDDIRKAGKTPLIDDQDLALVTAVKNDGATVELSQGGRGTIPLEQLKWARVDMPGQALGPAITKAQDVLKVGDVVIVAPINDSANYRLEQIPEVNGALVAVEPQTGKVLAMSGGYAFGKGSEFNRATQAMRQPGSAFKPFVYLTALENGFTPSSIVLDAPVEMVQGAGLPMWRPKNYEEKFLGPTTLRKGLEKSRNTMTVRLGQMVGIGRVIRMAQRFGIYDQIPRNFSIVLGSHETTLLKLVTAYGEIANGGLSVSPSMIEQISDRHGAIIFRRDARECVACNESVAATGGRGFTPPQIADTRERIIDERLAYQMTTILEGVVQRGTGTGAKVLNRPVAGKTGTTNESRDTWFVGYTPELACGIYVGYDQPASLGRKETGGRVALPGFVAFMQEAMKNAPVKSFVPPSGIQQMAVEYETGQPLIDPAFAMGRVATESFIVGEPLFKPESEQEAVKKDKADPALAPPDQYGSGFNVQDGWQPVSPDYYMPGQPQLAPAYPGQPGSEQPGAQGTVPDYGFRDQPQQNPQGRTPPPNHGTYRRGPIRGTGDLY